VAAIGPLKLNSILVVRFLAELETEQGPKVERGGLSVEKVEEWCAESRHLQGYSPRLCQLRTDGLAPASKY
jgi:hypothetical protein